jgi:hypothetical protein
VRQLELPGRLASGTYVYGLHQMTIEQINNTTGTVTYLHHDQAGSTRLLTARRLISMAMNTGFT